MHKLIIDTNIWISFLIGKSLKGLQYFLQDNRFQIITSNEQISELVDVLSRPKIQKYFSCITINSEYRKTLIEYRVNQARETVKSMFAGMKEFIDTIMKVI